MVQGSILLSAGSEFKMKPLCILNSYYVVIEP